MKCRSSLREPCATLPRTRLIWVGSSAFTFVVIDEFYLLAFKG
jgi:hypothetical protein